jgi:hypothetical protein
VGGGGGIMEIVKESSALDGKVESFLSTLLEGYENNIKQVNEFIEQHETQVEGAKKQRDEWMTAVDDLKTLLELEGENAEED